MGSEADEILKAVAGKSKVLALPGTFVSFDAAGYTVDVGGGRIPASLGSDYLPAVNDDVWVWFVDGRPFVMGPTTPKPGRGTVVSSASGLVTVSTSIGDVTCPYASGLTPTVGQILQLTWRDGPYAESVMSTSPAGGVAPPAPGGGATTHVDTFTAIDAGSYGSRWWTGQVYASDSNVGYWFYGSKLQDTLPSNAIMQNVEVYMSISSTNGVPANFGLHQYYTRPVGPPPLTSLTAVGISSGWVKLPPALWNGLRNGGGYAGIGVDQGGYTIFNSLADDGWSGALRTTAVY